MNTKDVTISLIIYEGEAGKGDVIVVGHNVVGWLLCVNYHASLAMHWSSTIVVIHVVVVHCPLWPCIVHHHCTSAIIVDCGLYITCTVVHSSAVVVHCPL